MGIKVLSLCDGMSCAHVALDKAGIDVDKYYASEIKDIGIKVTQENYPDTIQIGDVTQVHYANGILHTEKGNFNVGKIDMVTFGSPCFEAGTKVLTIDGYKNIEDVCIGDLVLTHTGQYQRVLNVGGKITSTVELHCQGMIPTRVTLNHPYYVRHMTKSGHKGKRVLSNPEWIPVSDLKKDDFIGIPIIKTEENPYNLTMEECWLMGRYVADGYINNSKRPNRKNSYNHKTIFCIGKHKLDDFKTHLLTYHGCIKENTTTYKVEVINERFMKMCMECGKGAENKKVPQFILNLPIDLANEFLNGYLSGDGHHDDELCVTNCITVSKELTLGIELLVAKCRHINTNITYHIPPKTKIIENRIVNQKPSYTIRFNDDQSKQMNAFIEEHYIWTRFRYFDNLQEEKQVYNLEVENDNSYTANNVVVHNCQSFSQAMKTDMRIGLADPVRSGLFFECYRVLKEVNPTWWLLENVASMKKDDQEILSTYMGVKPIRINGKLVSAALRDRLYWTNIPNVTVPEDKGIKLQDILTSGYVDREKARCLLVSDSRPLVDKQRMMHRYRNTGFTTIVWEEKGNDDTIRYLNQTELERCHNIPEGYTKCLTRNQAADVIGDGWTINVISHIFSFIPTAQNGLEKVG